MIRFDNHAFKGLDDSLRTLYTLLGDMAQGTQDIIALLKGALEVADESSFARAKEIDKQVNAAELKVDSNVVAIINKFTVMGEELRFVLGTVKLSGTLERAADKMKNCAKRLGRTSRPIEPVIKGELATALDALAGMFPLSMQQLLEYDPAVTQALLAHGATVQESYRNILLRLHQHHSTPDDETHLLLIAKNIEQTADMAVEMMKIAHTIHFATKFDKRA